MAHNSNAEMTLGVSQMMRRLYGRPPIAKSKQQRKIAKKSGLGGRGGTPCDGSATQPHLSQINGANPATASPIKNSNACTPVFLSARL